MVFGVPHQISPFHFIMMAGRHVHHLVFGMLIRLAGGLWLCEFARHRLHFPAGQPFDVHSVRSRPAITLDEFAMCPTCATSTGREKDAPALTQ